MYRLELITSWGQHARVGIEYNNPITLIKYAMHALKGKHWQVVYND